MTFMFCHGPFRWLCLFALSLSVLVLGASTGFAQTRAAVPAAAKQKEITKLLEETYNLAKLDGVSKKQNALKQLTEASRKESFGTDERYVILMTAISIAKEIGDATRWLEAVNTLVADFDVNPQKEKTRLLIEFLNASKPGTQFKLAIEEALAMSQAAVEENQFAEANALLDTAEAAVRRITGAGNLKPIVAAARVTTAAREKEWKAYQAANTKLKADGNDAAANLVVGRWHALQVIDWKAALPFLAKASDVKWKAAAELELAEPGDATAQVAMGDAWWDLAQKETGSAKTAVLLHAGEWYDEARPNVTLALKRELITKRLDEIASLKTSDPKTAALVRSARRNSERSNPTKIGEWVDLLEWTEGADWSNSGINWNDHVEGVPSRSGIRLKPSGHARFPLSAILDGDYDLEIRFTRHEGDGTVVIHFPIGVHTMRLLLGSDGGSYSQVAFFDATPNNIERKPGNVSNGHEHTVLIRVRRNGQNASFNVDFDDIKDYHKWEGPYSSLRDTDPSPNMTTMLQRVWLGNYLNGSLVFSLARLRMLSGTIERDPLTAADRKRDLQNGYVRLVGEKPLAIQRFEGMVWINQLKLDPPLVMERWPRVSREFEFCNDYYGAHAPSRLKCPVPAGAKSFSVVGYNSASGTSKFQVEVDGKRLHSSATTNIDLIKVDLPSNASIIQLIADPAGSTRYDHVYWCYPRFHAVTAERVTDKMLDGKPGPLPFSVASSEVGFGSFTHNEPIQPICKTIPINFRDVVPCHEFIFAHAPSSITYEVPDGMTRFMAVGSSPLSNSVKFEVWADDKRAYISPQAGLVSIDVKLPVATKKIVLKIDHLDDASADHSYWCYPRLHRN